MADQQDLIFTYTQRSSIFRLSVAKREITSAPNMNGDFSMSLEESSEGEAKFIADSLPSRREAKCWIWPLRMGTIHHLFHQGKRCYRDWGWPWSEDKQRPAKIMMKCDCKGLSNVKPRDFGTFDAFPASVGWRQFSVLLRNGKLENKSRVRDFFQTIRRPNCLSGGRFYMQNHGLCQALWSTFKDIDVNAEKGFCSACDGLDDQGISLFMAFPYGAEMVIRNSRTSFKFELQKAGRSAWITIRTIGQWRKKFSEFGLEKSIGFMPRCSSVNLTSTEF